MTRGKLRKAEAAARNQKRFTDCVDDLIANAYEVTQLLSRAHQ